MTKNLPPGAVPPPAPPNPPPQRQAPAPPGMPPEGDAPGFAADRLPAPASRKVRPWWRRWLDDLNDAVGWAAREAAEWLASGRAAGRLREFSDLATEARRPEEVEAALVRAAVEVSGSCRVELVLDQDAEPRLVSLAPESAAAMTDDEVEALGYPLCLGLWCGDNHQMSLQIYARRGQLKRGRWSPQVVRRLTTLCALAAAAERDLHAGQRTPPKEPTEGVPTVAAPPSPVVREAAAVRDATFLNAVLPYALAQAQRHREPLTVFCVELDGIAALTRTHGPTRVEQAAIRMAEAIARTLRASDVVAKLDDDRVFVVLPNTGGANALTVANVVHSAIASACPAADGMPALTASVGIALYPNDARDMLGLLSASDEAMARARSTGPNQIALAGPPTSLGVLHYPQFVADAVTDTDPDPDEEFSIPHSGVRSNPPRRTAAG